MITTAEDGLERAEIESTPGLGRAVAAGAFRLEQGLHMGRPEGIVRRDSTRCLTEPPKRNHGAQERDGVPEGVAEGNCVGG